MGCRSFQKFFDTVFNFDTKSLLQTKVVLEEREQLKTLKANMFPQIQAGISNLQELRDQLKILKKHTSDVENNKNFECEVEETKLYREYLPRGQHV